MMTKKLKIAYIGQKGIENVVGGVETHVRELAVRAARAGYDVIVYARPYTMKGFKNRFHGVFVKRLPSIHTKHLDTITHVFLATLHAIFFVKADIAHYHGVGPSLLSFLPRLLKPSMRVIATFHSIDREHAKWGRFARWVLKLGEWTACHVPHTTITVSKTLASYCGEQYRRETVMIPNGISDPSFPSPTFLKERFGLKPHSYFLILSRLVPHKNIHEVIEALGKIKTAMKLVVVGDGTFTGSYTRQIDRMVQLDPRVQLVGRRSGEELAALFAHCAFFVSASRSEGCPTAVLEAMSYGNPVLLADLPANREFTNGWGFFFQDLSDLSRKLEWMADHFLTLSNDPAMQDYVLKHYHWDRLAPRIFDLYDQLALNHHLKTHSRMISEETKAGV